MGGGRDRVGGRQYTPLYKNGIKKTQNKSMETTQTGLVNVGVVFEAQQALQMKDFCLGFELLGKF